MRYGIIKDITNVIKLRFNFKKRWDKTSIITDATNINPRVINNPFKNVSEAIETNRI